MRACSFLSNFSALLLPTDAVAAYAARGIAIWRRSWARKLLLVTFFLIFALHSGLVNYALRFPLESRFAPLLDPSKAGAYDAIVVLTSGVVPASGLIPFSSIDGAMFRRLDEAWRLYRIQRKPIIVSGGHVNPFTPDMDRHRLRATTDPLGCAEKRRVGEGKSRDTFESAVEVQKL